MGMSVEVGTLQKLFRLFGIGRTKLCQSLISYSPDTNHPRASMVSLHYKEGVVACSIHTIDDYYTGDDASDDAVRM